MILYLGYALIQLPEALLSIYKRLKAYSNKALTPDNTGYKRKRARLNEIFHSKRALETSSIVRRGPEQKFDNNAGLDKFNTKTANEALTGRVDTIEQQIQDILSRLSNAEK